MTITLPQQTLKPSLWTVDASKSQAFKQIFVKRTSVKTITEFIKIKLNVLAFHTVVSAFNKRLCV